MTEWTKIEVDRVQISDALECGVRKISDTQVQIGVWRQGARRCDLRLYVDGRKVTFSMYPLKQFGLNDVFTIVLRGEDMAKRLHGTAYDFVADGESFTDPYARVVVGRPNFGRKQKRLCAVFDFAEFNWQDENYKRVSTDHLVLYQCHVRGFTKHSSSAVTYPGTFSGLQEKIPYLEELGVNAILCMPIYDFNECMKDSYGVELGRINYWGYTGDAFYFAPKYSFSNGVTNPSEEFFQLVNALHQKDMNIYLDMYFENQTPEFIMQCLRYYVLRFHVDGFRLNQGCLDATWLVNDPVLSRVRFIGLDWPEQESKRGEETFLQANDRFMIDARRFMKSDEGQAEKFYNEFREQKKGVGIVHYMTQHNGFTLRDLISYDVKHNEQNGEKNRDGTEYNYSWNCGVEGPSRKKEVLRRRNVQEKNALVMLLLGMATPMILAGDEFGNSQKGNNNAYCQDNVISWLDWRLLQKNQSTYQFVKKLLKYRKACALYHSNHFFSGGDAKGVGAPDVSCHGKEPWQIHFPYYSREVGVLYYGSHFGGKTLYFVFNFHWDEHEFYLPDIKKGNRWRLLLDTYEEEKGEVVEKKYKMQPRSIALFESIDKDGK